MLDRIRNQISDEPVIAVQAILALVVAFGLTLTGAQTNAIVGVVTALLGGAVVTRNRVTPS